MTEDRNLDAAERALGLDPRGAETAADAVLTAEWDERLAPLADQLEPVEPPEGLWTRIEAAIAPSNLSADVVELAAYRKRATTWRTVAAFATAVAAALALFIFVPTTAISPTPEAQKYVAVVTHDENGQAGLIIEIEPSTGRATVIPVTAPPAGRSYEMWTIPTGETAPVSLGLLPQNAVARTNFVADVDQIFAISLEPEGGSPTGQPTQALYHGRVVRVD
ncbi:MAG: anti-sigma factor [Pseudomonadota bacterium]